MTATTITVTMMIIITIKVRMKQQQPMPVLLGCWAGWEKIRTLSSVEWLSVFNLQPSARKRRVLKKTSTL